MFKIFPSVYASQVSRSLFHIVGPHTRKLRQPNQVDRAILHVGRRCHRGRLITVMNKQQRSVQECTHHQSTSDIGRENSQTSSAKF